MKTLLTIAFLFQAIILKAQNEYIIEGYITGIEDSIEISLLENEGNVLSRIDKDTIIAGRFAFRGKAEGLRHLALISNAPGFPSQWLDVYVAPSAKVRITGGNKLYKTWNVESPIKEQIELGNYTKALRYEIDELQKLSVIRNSLFDLRRKASGDERKVLKVAMDSVDKVQDSVYSVLYKKQFEILERSPVTLVWMSKLKEITLAVKYSKMEEFRERAGALLSRLNSTQANSAEGREIRVNLYPPQVIKTGEMVPDKALFDLAGKQHSLRDYKGKYLLLDFWSVGCGPCIMAMPELSKLSSSHQDSLSVISLSLDLKKETWRKATESHKINWVNLSDGSGMAGIAAQFGVEGIPHYVLISPEGKLLSSWTGFSEGDLEKRISKVIHK